MQRVNVVGTSGSGKSSVGKRLARQMGVPYVELDALSWEPNWVAAPTPILRDRVAAAIAGEAWVVDGNYSAVRDLLWARVDTVIWLDLPLRTVVWRVVRRTARRLIQREVLWGTNRESLWMALSRDSIIWWAISTHGRRRRDYRQMLDDLPGMTVVRLRSGAEVDDWLAARGGPVANSGR
jgi:adenylate kinase family enzyme